jgi:hypothetical protein
MIKMPWYDSINKKLLPCQLFVDILLISIIIVSLWLIIKGKPLTKTAWLTYLISP